MQQCEKIAAMKNQTAHESCHIIPLTAFRDNYIWLLRGDDRSGATVVDPGDAAPVLEYLKHERLTLSAILVTHHHNDHIGGIAALRARYPGVPVFGPRDEAMNVVSVGLGEGEWVDLSQTGSAELRLEVLAVPGHTRGHLAYYDRNHRGCGALFCGDTLFSAGCGRLFEGTSTQMQSSLARLRALPAETLVYCAHEYTEANLRFAMAVEPDNEELANYAVRVAQLRAAGQPTLPSTLALECAINPFLRWDAPAVQQAAARFRGRLPANPGNAVEVFAAIREWKDGF